MTQPICKYCGKSKSEHHPMNDFPRWCSDDIADKREFTPAPQLEPAPMRKNCILNCDSPSFPPSDYERRQCGCENCLKDLSPAPVHVQETATPRTKALRKQHDECDSEEAMENWEYIALNAYANLERELTTLATELAAVNRKLKASRDAAEITIGDDWIHNPKEGDTWDEDVSNSIHLLRVHRDSARAEAARYKHELTDVTTHRDQLRAEVAALRKDSVRLDYLDSLVGSADFVFLKFDPVRRKNHFTAFRGQSIGDYPTARAAIDILKGGDEPCRPLPSLPTIPSTADVVSAVDESNAAPEKSEPSGDAADHAPMAYETFVLMKQAVEAQCKATAAAITERDSLRATVETQARQIVAMREVLERAKCLAREDVPLNVDSINAALSPDSGNGWVKREVLETAYEIIHAILAEGRGSEFYPTALDGSKNEMFIRAWNWITRAETALNPKGGKTE